jgi:hypothetical protein
VKRRMMSKEGFSNGTSADIAGTHNQNSHVQIIDLKVIISDWSLVARGWLLVDQDKTEVRS